MNYVDVIRKRLALRPLLNWKNKDIFYYMKGNKKYLFNFTQTAIPQITVEEILENYILKPPLQEQKTISEYLDKKLAQIDKLIEKSKKAIKLLKEKKNH